MKLLRGLTLATLVFFLLAHNDISFSNEKEDFPKIGFVKNDGANVRAGDNVNFKALCELEKGDPLKIIGKRYSWFKINLPKKAHIYIKNDYVALDPEKEIGTVTALHVNLRAGPGTEYSILGQVSRPEKLNVVSEKDGWYKIEPPQGIKGWISSSQIKFILEDMDDTETKKDEKNLVDENQKPKDASIAMQSEEKVNLKMSFEPAAPQGNLKFSTQGN